MNAGKYGCNKCHQWCEVIDDEAVDDADYIKMLQPKNDTPPIDGEIVAEGKAQVLLADKCNEWYDAYGMEIADGADPRGVIQRLLVEHEKRMNESQTEEALLKLAYEQGHIQGQIDAYEWLLEHGSGGGNWRRLCVQKITQLKGE